MSTLPPNWTRARLGDVMEMGPGIDSPDDLEVGFVPLQRLGTAFLAKHSFEVRKWADVKKGYTHFADGDVLLARITPSFENGKAGIARNLPNGIGAGSTEYLVCRPEPGVLLPEYLLAFFKTRKFLEDGVQLMSGAVGQQRVPRQYVLDCEIPLAPLEEQRRIAEKIGDLLRNVDSAVERLERVPRILERFRQSVLSAASSGKLTAPWRQANPTKLSAAKRQDAELASRAADLPDSWGIARAAEVVEPDAEIVYGIVQPGPRLAAGVPYVRGTDIQDGKILVNQLLKTSLDIAARYSRASIKGGDVLLGIIRATKVAIVPDELDGANITQGTARLRPSRTLRSKYLALVLEAPGTQRWLHGYYRGIDMPGLNLADVRRVPIPVPPLEEQDEIVTRVQSLLESVERVAACHARALSYLGSEAQTVLTQAFLGELVPQQPDELNSSRWVRRPRNQSWKDRPRA